MKADNSAHLAHYRAQQEQERVQRVEDLLGQADAGEVTWRTLPQFLQLAKVSKSWVYDSKYRERVLQVRDDCRRAGAVPPPPREQRASEASLRERLASSHAENARLRAENELLRQDLANALGLLRAGRSGGV